MYICLFTCANTRAVHLEVVTDLTEENFIQAFRRFVGRKSLPQLMISDNASTYQSAAKELEKLFSSTLLSEHLSKQGTRWQFIPKKAGAMVWWILGKIYWTNQDHTQEGARKIIYLINQSSDYCG